MPRPAEVRDQKPRILGLSLVLAGSREEVGKVMDALREAGLRDRVKVMIGGVAANKELAKQYGCDAFVGSAFDFVQVCNELLRVHTK